LLRERTKSEEESSFDLFRVDEVAPIPLERGSSSESSEWGVESVSSREEGGRTRGDERRIGSHFRGWCQFCRVRMVLWLKRGIGEEASVRSSGAICSFVEGIGRTEEMDV